MKRISAQKESKLVRGLSRIFINSSKNPETFQLLLLVSQMLIFTYFVSLWRYEQLNFIQRVNQNLQHLIMLGDSKIRFSAFILITLVINLCLRCIFLKNFIKVLYLVSIIAAQQSQQPLGQVIRTFLWLFVGINILSDIISNYQYSFVTQNFYAQTLNSTKFLHYAVIISCTLLRIYETKIFGNGWICSAISLSLLLIILIIKCFSFSKNKYCQQLHLRFYSLSVFIYLANIIQQLSQDVNEVYKIGGSILVSQLAICILLRKIDSLKTNDLIAAKNKCHICFRILSYCFSMVYDENLNIMIQEIIQQKMQNDFKMPQKINFKFETNNRSITLLGNKLQQLLTQNQSFTSELLKLQILFHIKKQTIKSKKMILDMKKQNSSSMKFYNFPYILANKLLIYRIQTKLTSMIDNQYQTNRSPLFDEFIQNQILRIMLTKITLDYINLWELINKNINKKQIVYSEVLKYIQKILKRTQKYKNKFNKTKVIGKSMILRYIEYLFKVQRNVDLANQTFKKFWIFPQLHNYLHLQQKIYFSVGLDKDNFMIIQGIGYNVKKILGYERKQVLGQNVSMFVPQFFKSFHETKIQNRILVNQKNYLFNFYKQTLIHHHSDYFLPLSINVKIVYDIVDSGIYMEGYLRVEKQNRYYDWKNYFFVADQTNELLLLGGFLAQEYRVNKDTQILCSDVFTEKNLPNLDEKKQKKPVERPKYFYQKGSMEQTKYLLEAMKDKKYYNAGEISYEYHQLLEIKLHEGNKVKYYVAKNNQLNNSDSFDDVIQSESQDANSQSQLLIQAKYNKFNFRYEDFSSNLPIYFQQTQKSLNKMNIKKYKFSLPFVIVLILAMIGLQIFLIQNFRQNERLSDNNIKDFINLKNQTFAINQLFILATSLTLTYYGVPYPSYSSLQHVQERFIILGLQMQTIAEQISKYNPDIFQTNQQINEESERIQDLPKLPKTIILQSTIPPFLSNYLNQPSVHLNSLNQMMITIKQMYAGLLDKYLENYFQKVSSQLEFHQIRIIICLSLIILFSMIILMIILLKMKFLNVIQYEVISSLVRVNIIHIFLNSANQFLNNFVGGASSRFTENNKSYHNNLYTQKNQDKPWQDNPVLVSVTNRQSSVRNLVEDMNTTFRTPVCQDNQQQQDQSKSRSNIEKDSFKSAKSLPKKYIVLFTLITLSVIVNSCIYLSQNRERKIVFFGQQVPKIGLIFEKQVYFSESIITFISYVIGNLDKQIFQSRINLYKQIQNLSNDNFMGISLKSYSQFTEKLNDYKYTNICLYFQCNQQYSSEINMIYKSLLHKMIDYMQNNQQITQITQQSFQFLSLIQSQYATKTITNDLIMSYLDAFTTTSTEKREIIFNINIFNLSLITLMGIIILGVAECLWIRQKNKKIQKIVNFIQKGSYVLENETTSKERQNRGSGMRKNSKRNSLIIDTE